MQALQALDEFGPLDFELTGRKTQLLLRLGDVVRPHIPHSKAVKFCNRKCSIPSCG